MNNQQTTQEPTSERDAAIARAMQSVLATVPRAAADPQRPRYHFGPPAQWMNDPNGTIFANGYYHLFYQHNPYGDKWGHMHWGHARSRDLVKWEHLPIALWPSHTQGENHCFSGCAAITADGTPILIYTSVGPGKMPERANNEQWAAIGDAEWITWQKHPSNPILALPTHGGPPFEGDWRDPYIFHAEGRTFLVVAGNVDDISAIALYEASNSAANNSATSNSAVSNSAASNGSLATWQFRSVLHTTDRASVSLSECPNFFAAQDEKGSTHWVLLTSPYRQIDYEVGDFDLDTLTFTPATKGVLDAGFTHNLTTAHFYATNTLTAPDGRLILLGWIRGFTPGRGWNGCLALPRTLTIGADRRPRQKPIVELEQLRGRALTLSPQTLPTWPTILFPSLEASLELDLSLGVTRGQSIALHLRAANNVDPSLTITYDGTGLTLGDAHVPFALDDGEALRLRLFVDCSTHELFVNDGRVAITLVKPLPNGPIDVEIETGGSQVELLACSAWELAPVHFDMRLYSPPNPGVSGSG